MLSLTTRQQALIDGGYKISNWLIVVTDINSNRYYWSTRNVPNTEEHGDFIKWDSAMEWDSAVKWDAGGDNIDASNAFEFKIIDWPGIMLRRGSAESGILAPNDLDLTITNKDSALTADDFIGGTVWVHLSIGDNDGAEIFHRWRFRIKKAASTHQKITFVCQDFIQEYLRTDYPNEKLVDNIFPSDDQKDKDNLCVPIPFGTAYVPLRSVYITDQRYYLLGLASYTYTISAVHSPTDMPESEWTSPSYTFTQSTKADGDAVDWRVFQPIIADSDNDGVADASGLFNSGDIFLDIPTKFSRSDTVNITNPAYVIKFVLEDLGVAVDDINAASFATAAAIYDSWGLSFNGAVFYQQPAKDVITNLLNMCNSILISGEQIELHVLSVDSVKTITTVLKPQDVSEAIFSYTDISDETDYDSAYAAFQESNKPQNELIKIPVPVKSSYDYPSGEIIEMPFIQDSQNVQNATCLKLQREYLKKANIDFDSKGHLLALLPDDVITINDANYGGTYPVLVEEIHINKDLQLSFTCIRFKETLDNWDDLAFSSVTIAADDSTDYWVPIIAGPDSTLTGTEIPNQLRGRLRIGETGNYILLDPAEPIIKLDEGGIDRVLIGDLGTDNFGIQINNAAGNMVMKIDGSSAVLAGWNITTTTLTKNNALLDSAGKLELGTGNDIIILSAIDATYRLAIGHATYASAPFRVTKAGVLTATGATITGTITATAGVIGGFTVDATEGLYAGSGATRVQMKAGAGIWTGATAIGDAPFSVTNAGVLKAESGVIGGFTLSSSQLYAGSGVTRIQLDTGQGMWLGATVFGDAPFYVSRAGAITAESGTIGGWTLASDKLSAGTDADYIGLIPGVGIQMGDSTFADAEFSITNAGVLKAISGTIGGFTLGATTLTATNLILDADNDKITVDTITIDGANNRIRSANYVAGMAGSGFTFEPDLLEVGNIACRGIIRTAVFQKDIISAVGGTVAISKGSDILATTMTQLDAATLTIEGNETFSVNDILRIKDDTSDEWMLVTNVAGAPTYVVTRDQAAAYAADNNPAWTKGATVVNYGPANAGILLLTNTPYIDMLTHAGAPWAATTRRMRIGDLNGTYGYGAATYGIGMGAFSAADYITIEDTNGIRFLDSGDVVRAQLTAGVWTLGVTTSEHVSISATAVQFKDGATVLTEISGGNVLVGQTGAGQSNVYITGGVISLRNNVTDVITLSSAGVVGITVKSGGNITLESATSGNTAYAIFVGNLRTYYFGSDYDNDRLFLSPDTGEQGYLYIGFNSLGASIPFNSIFIRSKVKTEITSYVDSTHYSYIRTDTSGAKAVAKLGARDGGVESNVFVDDTYFYSSIYFSAPAGIHVGGTADPGTDNLIVDGIVKILERAAAAADTAGHGQLWIKNTTPCELWFTDDAGTDTQIV